MAPFKLRFSKMSKSRSNGSKGSSSNSVECEESGQQYQPNNSNIQALASCNSRPETPGNEAAAGFPDSPPPSYQHVLEEVDLIAGKLEESVNNIRTRLKRSTTNTEEDVLEEDEIDENTADEPRSNNQRLDNIAEEINEQRRNKTDEMQRSSSGGGGSPGGGGGGGGRTPAKGPEILHKSSKELYRAVAKQWGITCKMSDQCRCFDCQSHYFDCEYEKDEQGKTDGGLGAGTPMFIAEVMHGTACVLL